MKLSILLLLATLSMAEVCVVKVGMTYYEARDLDVSLFNCNMNFDGTIEALTHWIDIIEHRDQLIKDLAILQQIIKIIENAKGAAAVLNSDRIRPNFNVLLQWTSCNVDDAYQYVQRLNAQRTAQERLALANQIIAYLRQAQGQIYRYVDSCRNVQLTTHLRQKIAQLQAMKKVCEEYDDETVCYEEEDEYEYVYVYEEEAIEIKTTDEPQYYQYQNSQKQVKTSSVIKQYGTPKNEASKVVDAHSTYGPIHYVKSQVGEECEYYDDTVNQPEPDYVEGVEEQTEKGEEQIGDDPIPDDQKENSDEETIETMEESSETVTDDEKSVEEQEVQVEETIGLVEETDVLVEEDQVEEPIEDEPVPDDERIVEEESKDEEVVVEITEETITEDTVENKEVPKKDPKKKKQKSKQSAVNTQKKKQYKQDKKIKPKPKPSQPETKEEEEKKEEVVEEKKEEVVEEKKEEEKELTEEEMEQLCKPQFGKPKKSKKVLKRVRKPGQPRKPGTKTRKEARQQKKLPKQQPLPAICYGSQQYVEDILGEEFINEDQGRNYLAIESLINEEHERSLKLQSVKDEYNPNEPTQFQPPKHRASSGRVQEQKAIAVNTKYYDSDFDGEVTEQYEFSDRALLQDSSEYGYGYWVRFSEHSRKQHPRQEGVVYFLSRMTTNEEYEDISFYGDRTLAVFLFDNSFVFSTYDTSKQLKTKDTTVVLNENMDSMWYFVVFSYSAQQRKAVGYVVTFGGPKYRAEIDAQHVPPAYIKLIFGGKHLEYPGLNGQFANLFYDIDAPAFIDGDEALDEVIAKLSNIPQELPILIEETIVSKPITTSGNTKGEQFHFDPQESQLLIEEYAVALWFRWVDDLKVDEPNAFQILNLRSNKQRTAGKGVLGDRALELHYIYGGGAKSSVYYNTYTIYGNKGKGSVNILKSIESSEFLWTYVYFGYKTGRAFGALIRPGMTGEVYFEGIQHKQVNHLSVTLGGDETISPFNGKIAFVGVYLGNGAYREGLQFDNTFNYNEVVNVYQVGKPVTFLSVDQNKYVEFDQPDNIVDKIIIHDENSVKINGQSEYAFGLWTRWITTLPKYLTKRSPVHTIARVGAQGYVIESVDGKLVRANAGRPSTAKDITLACVLTQKSYEFQTLTLKDEVPFQDLEGQWNYLYFGYKRIGNEGVAKGYVQFGVEGEVDEVQFDVYHEFLVEYVEFLVGKTSAPLFNGEIARVTFSVGPGAYIPSKETLKLYTQNSLPEKAQIHPVTRQTLQIVGAAVTINDEPIQYEFDRYQGAEEYSVSGWIRWSGAAVTGQEAHVVTLAQKRLVDLDGSKEETLQIIRGDQLYRFTTYSGEQFKLVSTEQEFHEYADQWNYIYFGYSQQKQKTYGYVRFPFSDSELVQENVSHFYLAVFSVLLGSKRQSFVNFNGQMKTWVVNVGFGAFREGNFEEDENIKIHFGYISGTDHIKSAGQEAHHHETILECGTAEEEPPLQIEFEQSPTLQLHGVSEYGYGYWLRFQYFAEKQIIFTQPQLMGVSRLTSNREYKDYDNLGDRVLLVLMDRKQFFFGTYDVASKTNNVGGQIEYKKESEGEWQYVYFSYKRVTQQEAHAIAFTQFQDHTEGLQMDVMHKLLTNYLYLSIGHAGKYYQNFNGQITKIRFNLGPGSYIDTKQGLLSILKNKDPIPDSQITTKNYEILAGKHDVSKLDEKVHLTHFTQEAREYGIQLWFRWFKLKTKTTQIIYRFASTNPIGDAQKIGDRTLALFHTEGVEFSTYNIKPVELSKNYPVQILPQYQEVWTFVYFAYSKQEQKISYYINTEDVEQHSLESTLHVVANNYWLYLAKDALIKSFDSRLAQVVVNFGDGAFRSDNYKQLVVYLASPRLFNPDAKFQWEYSEEILVLDANDPAKNGEKITLQEPDRKIESVQEYSVGLWTRFLQAWPQRLWTIPNEMQIFRLTYNDEPENGKLVIGDRVLSAYVINGNYQFGTYDLNDDSPNEMATIPYHNLEGQWYYIYAGYKRVLQQASYYVFDGKKIQSFNAEKVLHKPLGDYIHLILGGEKDVHPFQGLFNQITAHLGKDSYKNSEEALLEAIESSYALPQELLVSYIHKQKRGQVELDREKVIETSDWSGVGEYALSGWFKIAEKQIKIEGEITSPCQLLFRITNNDKFADRKQQGDRTLHSQICTSDTIKLSTYTIEGLRDWNEAKYLDAKIEMGYSKKAWTYFYMSYSESKREVQTLVKLFEQDATNTFNNVQHFVINYMGVYLGNDPFSRQFQGELQKWELLLGQGVHTQNQEQMPNLRYILKNTKNLWFSKDDKVTDGKIEQTFNKEVESVSEYAIGVWTRWLIAYPTTLTERADIHTIFRFSQTQEYQDKSEAGNRVLSAFLNKGNYQFSTYDVKQPNFAVDASITYDNLEGEWNYIYASYKNNQFYGMIYFRDRNQMEHVELQVTHTVLTGYAHLILGATEFGYKAFHGWFYDPRVFIGNGASLNEDQSIVDMMTKLHRKLPVSAQSAEGFEWPIKMLDTTHDDDLESKKNELKYEFDDKQEMMSYSIGFWYQNAPLLPEMEDILRGLVRLTTNNDEVGQDDKFIGDRTLALFTKTNELVFSTYTIKDPSFESLSHSFNIKPYLWTFVYFGYHHGEARTYVLQPGGSQEYKLEGTHMVPNKLYLHLVNDIGHPSFWGKLYGLKVNFGDGSYLDEPQQLIDKWPFDPNKASLTKQSESKE